MKAPSTLLLAAGTLIALEALIGVVVPEQFRTLAVALQQRSLRRPRREVFAVGVFGERTQRVLVERVERLQRACRRQVRGVELQPFAAIVQCAAAGQPGGVEGFAVEACASCGGAAGVRRTLRFEHAQDPPLRGLLNQPSTRAGKIHRHGLQGRITLPPGPATGSQANSKPRVSRRFPASPEAATHRARA